MPESAGEIMYSVTAALTPLLVRGVFPRRSYRAHANTTLFSSELSGASWVEFGSRMRKGGTGSAVMNKCEHGSVSHTSQVHISLFSDAMVPPPHPAHDEEVIKDPQTQQRDFATFRRVAK